MVVCRHAQSCQSGPTLLAGSCGVHGASRHPSQGPFRRLRGAVLCARAEALPRRPGPGRLGVPQGGSRAARALVWSEPLHEATPSSLATHKDQGGPQRKRQVQQGYARIRQQARGASAMCVPQEQRGASANQCRQDVSGHSRQHHQQYLWAGEDGLYPPKPICTRKAVPRNREEQAQKSKFYTKPSRQCTCEDKSETHYTSQSRGWVFPHDQNLCDGRTADPQAPYPYKC